MLVLSDVLEIKFFGDFSQLLITGELLDFKKKNELAKSYGGRNSLILRSVQDFRPSMRKKKKNV